MKTVATSFCHLKAVGLHVLVDFHNYSFDAYNYPLNGLKVHSAKLLGDVWVIRNNELTDKFLYCRVLIILWVPEDVLKHYLLDVLE